MIAHRVVSATAKAVIHAAAAEPWSLASYYFCCETCGNCGKHRRLYEDAQQDAVVHVTNHPRKEGQNAS